jgi:23S rRNA pseudouridine1911/1915/1917 synthase
MNEVPGDLALGLEPGRVAARAVAGVRRLYWRVADDEDGCTVEAILKRDLGLSEVSIKRAKALGKDTPFFLQAGRAGMAEREGDAWCEARRTEAQAPLAGITLDGLRARTDVRVRAGQILAVVIDDEHLGLLTGTIEADEGDVDAVYETDDLCVVNKPAGLVMYPGAAWRGQETLANRMAWRFERQGLHCNVHPVHRLDKDTSGLVVFAKNSYAHSQLQTALHTGAFQRTYLAICMGHLAEDTGVVDAPIARLGWSPSVFGIAESGKRAVTHFRTMGRYEIEGRELSLVELQLETGRSHQIRIHMQSLGHPLLGDAAYGGADALLGRAALHSWRLRMVEPVTGKLVELEAGVPEDLAGLMPDALRSDARGTYANWMAGGI